MSEVEERVSELDKALTKLAYAQINTQARLDQLSLEMREFKDEMREFKDEMREFKDEVAIFKDETRQSFKDMNKRWGEIANKLGTIAEDIVAPNIPRIAREYFGCQTLDSFTIHSERRQPTDRSKRREFDVIAVGDDKVILNETKSTVRDVYVTDFIEFVKSAEFFRYFPELSGKQLVPIFAALYVPEDKVRRLTRAGIFVMTMSDDTMDLVNYAEIAAS